MAIDYSTMTVARLEEFLATPRHAVMATIKRDGSPQLSVLWFLFRKGKLYTSIFNSSAKYFNIRRDSRVTLCIDAGHPDARSVTIYGNAELIEEKSAWSDEIERSLAYRYHDSAEAAEAYLQLTKGPDGSVIIVTPIKILSQDYS